MKKLLPYIFTGLIITGLSSACTDLGETLYSEVLQDNYFKTEEEVISAISPVYGNLRGFVNDTWQLGTHSSDESLTPEKALGHWFGEDWPLINSHKWTPQHVRLNNAWNFNFTLVNTANKVLYQLESVENMDAELKSLFIAELKMIRGWAYYNLIDLFGNVPLVTGWVLEDDTPPTTPRTELFNAIVSDLESNVEALSDKVDASTYGRFNKYAGYALLAKFYLNAEAWTGTPQWNKVIEYCDKIIGSEQYTITDDYFDNFMINNEDSKENIFVIPYDQIYTTWGNTIPWRALHYAQSEQFGLQMIPWNGFTAIPSFIYSFDPDDKRLKGWLYGQQYSASGELLYCSQESKGKPLNLTIDYINIYDPNDGITYNASYALEFMGARFAKYEYGAFLNTAENDFAIYRYADVLLMKAEVLMRQNSGTATDEAVNLVNLVRERAFDSASKLYTTSTLTLDVLLAERGWEFYCEGFRRNDLVRFGKFIKGSWEFYDRSWETETYNLFPIPQNQIDANPDLIQNPGY
jgi:hypothetical protein